MGAPSPSIGTAEPFEPWAKSEKIPRQSGMCRPWDVISLNFGHWSSGGTREEYQEHLELIISQLEKTGAKLIWVTTCPVPLGYGKALVGRKAGRMRLQNEWAAEVVPRHPKITVRDQWQFVKDNRDGIYTEWWRGRNVHFGGKPADELGRLLAQHVMEVLGGK